MQDLDVTCILHLVNFRNGARAPTNVHIYCRSPGDGQTSCKVWLASVERRRCSNEAYTRKLLKLAGMPKTTGPISAVSGPKFTILCGHMEKISLLNSIFPIVDRCLSCEHIARQSCAMVPRWRYLATFLRPVFSASRVQQVSDLHLKFALRPHHMWKYGRHPICSG